MNLIIETERLLLRPYTVNDIEAAYQMNLDPEVSRYTGDGGVHSLEEIDTIIRTHVLGDYQKHGFGRMAVVWKETNEYIGFSGLKYLPEFDAVDIGYRFKSAFWGKGIATEANLPFIDYGFKTLKLNKIIGMAFPENKASVRVLEKLGLRFKKWIEEDGETLAWYEIQNPLGLSS